MSENSLVEIQSTQTERRTLSQKKTRSERSLSKILAQRTISVLVTLLTIAFLTIFGLILAERGRARLPAEPLNAAGEALARTFSYILDHPQTYYWAKQDQPAARLVLTTLRNSAALLLSSLGVAALFGVTLGTVIALSRKKSLSPLMLLLSVLGISTPSFLLAMLLWVINLKLAGIFGIKPFPPTGFGWDLHLLMPMLVLVVRPLAQVTQVTYVTMNEILGQEYIRTAQAKGLPRRLIHNRHALRNVLAPILTTLGTSLRFSLASLPVVEFFFLWPGVGLMLLKAIELGNVALITDLIISLGFLFLLVNLFLEFLYAILDPRLKDESVNEDREEHPSWREYLDGGLEVLRETWQSVRSRFSRLHPAGQARSARASGAQSVTSTPATAPSAFQSALQKESPAHPKGRFIFHLLGLIFANPAFLVGTILVGGLIFLSFSGPQLTENSPYVVHGVMKVEDIIAAPPFKPSGVFPWGTDHIGRDIQALVLAGARQTLVMAFLGMAARVLLGTLLGLIAGWWRGGWFDRLVTGAIGVWAAFPVTLFALILIQALGIQQGMWVFIVALCVVGWGEVAQYVRAQVISIKPLLYIEAARVVGVRTRHMLTRHVLPHLVIPLFVLGPLEMGGILMLLAELGFLNIFLGGGFRVEFGPDVSTFFSDVPEWGALLANIRDWWRSYPWMAWYPGVAFFLAIVAFNLWGEGLRRFLDESRINVSRLVNRYSLIALVVCGLGAGWLVRASTPIGVYSSYAKAYDTQRTMATIQQLTSPEMQGRETGTPGAERAAQYIAQQMQEIGLFPAGPKENFIQTAVSPRLHLITTPRLEIRDEQGNTLERLVYRTDFTEISGLYEDYGESQGAVSGLLLGPPDPSETAQSISLRNIDSQERIVVVRGEDLPRVQLIGAAGFLVVTDDPAQLQRKLLFAGEQNYYRYTASPSMYITPAIADRLLATAGTSLTEMETAAAQLEPGKIALTDGGAPVYLNLELWFDETLKENYYNVIGFIPGTGSQMGEGLGHGLDSKVIIVSAYYDGLGTGPDGTLYQGANDNASGMAMMLELARALKQSPHPPKKTVVFVAWAGGERYEGLSVKNTMGAKIGFSSLEVETVIELSGVGAGDGNGVAFGEGSSFRLVNLFESAAGRVGLETTSRGRGPHQEIPNAPGFGGRSALSIYLSWDGADKTAHLPQDTFEAIDPRKIRRVGQATLLALSVLSREVEY